MFHRLPYDEIPLGIMCSPIPSLALNVGLGHIGNFGRLMNESNGYHLIYKQQSMYDNLLTQKDLGHV